MGIDFGDMIRRAAGTFGDRTAVTCGAFEQTFTELRDRSFRLANALSAHGLAFGDRVALLGPNGPWTVEQTVGVAMGGFVRSGLYAHQTGEVNGYLLERIDARALIVHADLVASIRPYAADVEGLDLIVVYGGDPGPGELAYDAFVASGAPDDPQVRTGDDDLHVIRFSAGTTGRPKGIVHTVDAWRRMGDEFAWVTPTIDDRDAYLAVGPLTHAAVVVLWPMLRVGGRIVVVEKFDPGDVLDLIERERPTFTMIVPTMMQALAAHPGARERDLSSLRCVSYAASPISPATMAASLELFGPDVLHQWYAQSENVPLTMLLPHEHRPHGTEAERRRSASVGRPTPNTVIRFVDEQGHDVPPGEIGEIAVRTPGSMSYQWKDPEGTAERTLPDGCILTRDMGYMDDEGYVHLADRKEDMIISGGYNVWPAALEQALVTHSAVAEACVVGVPHERWGETPVAVVVLVSGATVVEEELIALTRERVGSVQKVTRVEFADELPKSALGKVLRREVRERFWAGRSERVAGA